MLFNLNRHIAGREQQILFRTKFCLTPNIVSSRLIDLFLMHLFLCCLINLVIPIHTRLKKNVRDYDI